MIVNGEEDEEIIGALIIKLWDMRETKNPRALEKYIEDLQKRAVRRDQKRRLAV